MIAPNETNQRQTGGLISRAYRSLKFKARHAYCRHLYEKYLRKVNSEKLPSLPPRPTMELTLMTCTGLKQLDLVRELLLSVHWAWPKLPAKVCILSDGTVAAEDVAKRFAWWPGEIHAMPWTTCAEYHEARGRRGFREFGNGHVLGRKAAAILMLSELGPTLFSDSDILWFKPFDLDLAAVRNSPVFFRAAQDVRRSYDEAMITEMNIAALQEEPFLNSGVCLAWGDVYTAANLGSLVEHAAIKPSYFSEQTILAAAARTLGSAPWTLDQIALVLDDQLWASRPTFAKQPWMARHYVGAVRHWFWRDALALRQRARTAAAASKRD